MENNDTNEKLNQNPYLGFLIYYFCFKEEMNHKLTMKYESLKKDNNHRFPIYFIKKSILDNLKNHFDYKTLSKALLDKKILKKIKEKDLIDCTKLKESILSEIIENLPKNYLEKIKGIKISEIEDKENNKNLIHNYIVYNINEKNEIIRIKILDEFDVINKDDLSSSIINKLKIFNNSKSGECSLLPNKKILFYYLDNKNTIYESGYIDKNKFIKIEYIFNKKEIKDKNKFIDTLSETGINIKSGFFSKNEIFPLINKDNDKDIINCYKFLENKIHNIEEEIKTEKEKKKTH